jgi:CO/xanthine dehydrogenase Mo-binding subunit
MPEIDVSIISNGEPAVGCGEPAVTVIAPAIGNAVFNAVGALSGSLLPATDPYGITLDEASIRWAAADGVSETVVATVLLLHEHSVDEIVPGRRA